MNLTSTQLSPLFYLVATVGIQIFLNCLVMWNEAILPGIYWYEVFRRLGTEKTHWENFSHGKEKKVRQTWCKGGGEIDFNIFVNICSHGFVLKVNLHELVSEFSGKSLSLNI